jgi:hypothetical protein
MIDLIIAVDCEAKYRRWLAADISAHTLDDLAPLSTRRVFTELYRAFASSLLFAYELAAHERSL